MGPLIEGETSNQRQDQLEVGLIGGGTSDWRWDLHLEVRPPFQKDLSAPTEGHFSFGLQTSRTYFYLLFYLFHVSHFLHDVGIHVYKSVYVRLKQLSFMMKFGFSNWNINYENEKSVFTFDLLDGTCT